MTKKIQVLDNISHKGLELFDLTQYELGAQLSNPDAILVRSHKLHGHVFDNNLKAVGRAGVGTDNIPVSVLTKMGIPVFYAPGANANAVKELVLAAILIGYRRLDAARVFLDKVVHLEKDIFSKEIETNKKHFVGREIFGKTLGVIGLGNIGVKVANAALALGMKVLAFDPHMSLQNALSLMPGVSQVQDLNTLLTNADIITIHVPLTTENKYLINEHNIGLLKEDALLLNFSRAEVVCEKTILNQLNQGKLLGYITDFPSPALTVHPKVLCFPHLGASTSEAEENSAVMVIKNLCNYLESGVISHSINFPDTTLSSISRQSSFGEVFRMVIINENKPGAIALITDVFSQFGFNIEQMVNTSRESVAVNILDVSGKGDIKTALLAQLMRIPIVLRVNLVG